ncbi:MAG: hypothetical protein ACRC0X_01030, partial [Brevinema sp.]
MGKICQVMHFAVDVTMVMALSMLFMFTVELTFHPVNSQVTAQRNKENQPAERSVPNEDPKVFTVPGGLREVAKMNEWYRWAEFTVKE